MSAPFAPPPSRLQMMVLAAFPVVFLGIIVFQLGEIGKRIALTLFVVANLLLWGSMLIGIYRNVYLPWLNKVADSKKTEQSDKDDFQQ